MLSNRVGLPGQAVILPLQGFLSSLAATKNRGTLHQGAPLKHLNFIGDLGAEPPVSLSPAEAVEAAACLPLDVQILVLALVSRKDPG